MTLGGEEAYVAVPCHRSRVTRTPQRVTENTGRKVLLVGRTGGDVRWFVTEDRALSWTFVALTQG